MFSVLSCVGRRLAKDRSPFRGAYQMLINKFLKPKHWRSCALWFVAPLGRRERKITALFDVGPHNTNVSEKLAILCSRHNIKFRRNAL
jgi:hypothetical protein